MAGSIHFEQFEPWLQVVFGASWSVHGSLSLWFDTPAFDGDALQAMVEDTDAPRRPARLMRADGSLIAHGSASAKVDDGGEVRHRLASRRPSEPARMLAAVAPGLVLGPMDVQVAAAGVEERLPLLTELLPEHRASATGACSAPLSTAIHAMRACESALPLAWPLGVGLFGAIEWQWLYGPMGVDRPYQGTARVLATGTSPRSEMLWTEAAMRDAAAGRDVTRMLMLSRLLKQGAPCDLGRTVR